MILPDLPANGRADVGSDEPKSPGWGAILVSLTQSPKVSTFPHFLISGSLPVSSFNPDGIVFQVRGWQCTGTTCKWRLSICLEFWNAVIPANEWSVIVFWWTVHFGVIVRAYLCFNWAKTDNWNDYVCSRDQLIFHWTWSTCLTQIEASRWESWRNVCEAIWWSNLDRWTLPLKGWVMYKCGIGNRNLVKAVIHLLRTPRHTCGDCEKFRNNNRRSMMEPEDLDAWYMFRSRIRVATLLSRTGDKKMKVSSVWQIETWTDTWKNHKFKPWSKALWTKLSPFDFLCS